MFFAAILIPALVQEHLNRVLGIEDFDGPREHNVLLRTYFETGVWGDQKVEEGEMGVDSELVVAVRGLRI